MNVICVTRDMANHSADFLGFPYGSIYDASEIIVHIGKTAVPRVHALENPTRTLFVLIRSDAQKQAWEKS